MENQDNFSKPACSCGHDKTNPKVLHKCEYSGFGQILYWIGISAVPVRVNFVCTVCNETIESTDDQGILKQYIGR
ncbi:MAG: hypothetical protein HYZ10_07980 [Ignavibacteriales bacterium]|nr:hypothetical protein [Ignavibacteriales bacterium]